MEKKKNIIIIISLVVLAILYSIIFYFVSGASNATKGYIIVSNLGGYYCKSSVCQYKTKEEMDTANKDFLIYQNNQLKGTYNLNLQERWNLLQNNSWQKFYGDFLGVEESLNVELLNFEYVPLTEEDQNTLKNLTNINYTDLDETEKIVLDIDENGTKDYLVTLSNQTENEKSNEYFSILYLVLNNKPIQVLKGTANENYTLPFYNVFSVFKLDERKEIKLIINKGYYDNIGEPSIIMLELDGKKVKEVVSDSAK